MNTGEIAAEYRLSHWARIMKERKESGLSIKAYCKDAGFHENSYFYWQRKLREAACERLAGTQTGLAGAGFAEVRPVQSTMLLPGNSAGQICIETGGYKITAGNGYPTEAIAALLRELTKPC